MTTYHDPCTCNNCGDANDFRNPQYEESTLLETYTDCQNCGHKDYWAYGFFESGGDGYNSCRKYSFRKE